MTLMTLIETPPLAASEPRSDSGTLARPEGRSPAEAASEALLANLPLPLLSDYHVTESGTVEVTGQAALWMLLGMAARREVACG